VGHASIRHHAGQRPPGGPSRRPSPSSTHHPAHDDLVQDVVDLVGVEDEVQLADVLEALVEHLHEHLDQIQDAQLALRLVHRKDKVERRVVPVDQLRVLAEAGQAAGPGGMSGGKHRHRWQVNVLGTARSAAVSCSLPTRHTRAPAATPLGCHGRRRSWQAARAPAPLQEVADRVCPLRQQREDLSDDSLLLVLGLQERERCGVQGVGRESQARRRTFSRPHQALVELERPRLPIIIDHDHSLDHPLVFVFVCRFLRALEATAR
jgi:hypothetical protein